MIPEAARNMIQVFAVVRVFSSSPHVLENGNNLYYLCTIYFFFTGTSQSFLVGNLMVTQYKKQTNPCAE